MLPWKFSPRHCALIFIISRSNTTQKSVTQTLHEPLFEFFFDSIKAKTLPER